MKKLLLTTICLATSAGLAFSQTFVSQTLTFSGAPNFSQPLTFNKYIGNASDITNIRVSYLLSIDGGLFIVDNDALTPAANISANFGASLGATSTDVPLLNTSFQPVIIGANATNSAVFNLGANQGDELGDFSPLGPDGASLIGVPQNSSGSGDVGSQFFSQYAGGGSFVINAVGNQIGNLSFNSGIETATTPVNAQGSITITYTVPEPSSAALLGLGALGLALRRRRA